MVFIYSNHSFYRKAYSRLDKNGAAALDYFFWSMCEAELSAYTPEMKNRYRDYRYNIFNKLNVLMETLPEPELEVDD